MIEQALSIAYDGKDDEPNNDFFNASYGLVFFGVPNLGLKLGNLEEITAGQLNQQLIRDLKVNKDSEATPFLQELKTKFMRVCHSQDPKFQIVTYYERRETLTAEVSYSYSYRNNVTDITSLEITRWDVIKNRSSLLYGDERFCMSNWY